MGSLGTVLVIDDEPNLREMLARGLRRFGYEVAAAADGPAALDHAARTAFDLAVCDLSMPGMDGLETLKALKEIQPAMEVVIVTGRPTAETRAEALRLGACDYVPKPYGLIEIHEALRRALEAA